MKLRKEYFNATYYYGKLIRWMIENANRESVYCAQCGNIANGIVSIERENGSYNVPLCKKHFLEVFPKQEGFPAYKTIQPYYARF